MIYLFCSVNIQRDVCLYSIPRSSCQYSWSWVVPFSTALSHSFLLLLSSPCHFLLLLSYFLVPLPSPFLTSPNIASSLIISILVIWPTNTYTLTCIYNFKSRFYIWKKTGSICLSEAGLFHLMIFNFFCHCHNFTCLSGSKNFDVSTSRMFSIHLYVDRHLSYVHVLTIVDSAVISMDAYISLRYVYLKPFVYIAKSIYGSYFKSIFSFLGNIHTGFQSSYTSLHSHLRVHLSPYPHQRILSFVFYLNLVYFWF